MGDLSPAEHRERAVQHAGLGHTLLEVEHEWSAVSLFYAAYHQVKAALLEDPVFDDMERLNSIRPGLCADDRRSSAHHMKKGQPGFGINELVLVLYRPVAGPYERLHSMSIDVRYQRGLRSGAIDQLQEIYRRFDAAVEAGQLRCAV